MTLWQPPHSTISSRSSKATDLMADAFVAHKLFFLNAIEPDLWPQPARHLPGHSVSVLGWQMCEWKDVIHRSQTICRRVTRFLPCGFVALRLVRLCRVDGNCLLWHWKGDLETHRHTSLSAAQGCLVCFIKVQLGVFHCINSGCMVIV